MTLGDLESKLKGAMIQDVLLGGFIDQQESPIRFRTIKTALCFELSSTFLMFELVGTTGTMRLALVDAFHLNADLDDDMLPALTSISEQMLDDTVGLNKIVALRLWDPKPETNHVTCGAVQLDLANGQTIFLDPTYHFGIRLGGIAQKQLWLTNWPGASNQRESILRLG